MSDPLSIAGSIAGIVQLSASVFQQVSKFVKDAKGAEKAMKDLADQTRNLSGVLQNLALLASSLEQESSTSAFKAQHLHACRETLLAVEKRLEKPLLGFDEGSRRQAMYRSLKWPLSSNDTNGLLAQIEGHRNTISLALSTDTLEGMLRCLEKQDGIIGSLGSLSKKMERLTAIQTRIQCDDKRREIINYFFKVNPQVDLQTSSRLRQPLTGLWLTESNSTFLKWMGLPHSGLWLSGIPGAGKTILSGVVIEEVLQKSSQSVAVAFFYCDYKNSESQKLLNILCTIAAQLGQQNDEAFSILEEYYEGLKPESGLHAEPEPKELIDLISTIISAFDKVFIVIDGVDECGDNVTEVSEAIGLLFEVSSAASIAVFSRDEQDIREAIADDFAHIEISAHTEDLELYIRAEMANRRQLRNLSIQNPLFAEEIRRGLVNGAQGMFRWVSCQLDYLCDLSTNRARREALDSLPPTLPETYHRLLLRVCRSSVETKNLVRRVLHWTIAPSQMTLAEMREAVSFASSPHSDFGPDDLIEEDAIFRKCSSLVRKARAIDRYHSVPVIELAHFTVKEYLMSIDDESDVSFFKFNRQKADEELSTFSLKMFVLKATKAKIDPLLDLKLNMNRIIDRFIGHHFYLYSTARLCGLFGTRINPDSHGKLWSQPQNNTESEMFQSLFHSSGSMSLIELAIGSTLRHKSADSSVLRNPWLEDSKERDRAAQAKSTAEGVLAALLSQDFTPLQLAAAIGHPELCISLIERTTDSGTRDFEECLYYAFGTIRTFMFSKSGAYVKSKYRLPFPDLTKPLSGFKQPRRTKAVEALLHAFLKDKAPCSPKSDKLLTKGFGGNTLLHIAASYGASGPIKSLLAAGFDTSIRNKRSQTPLDCAIANRSWDIATLLSPLSPVHTLAKTSVKDLGWERAMVPTLTFGDRVSMLPPSAAIISFAIQHDDFELLKAITSQRLSVDVELPDCTRCPRSPLVTSTLLGRKQMTKWLLSRGADVELSGCNHLPSGLRGVVSLIIHKNMGVDIIKLALEESLRQGVEWVDENLNPLHVAALALNSEAMKFLLANLKDHNQQFRSPLMLAAELNSTKAVRSLVKAGASLGFYDDETKTALMRAASAGNMEMIKVLDQSKEVALMTDHAGKTALQYALSDKDTAVEICNYFVKRGLEPALHDFELLSPDKFEAEEGPMKTSLLAYVLNTGCLQFAEGSSTSNPLSVAVMGNTPGLLHRLWRLLQRYPRTRKYLNEKTKDSYSPLCVAALYGKDIGLQQLLRYKADPNMEGCSQGSSLMAACTFGRLQAVKRLVRSGAVLSYTNEKGVYRNAFVAALPHPQIRLWFLVGRFQDQPKLSSESFWEDRDERVKKWSGISKSGWKLIGKNKRLKNESMIDYLKKCHHLKRWAEGRVLVP
ncbi:hypothetical protein CNYM01_08913 [Colletotrichum nymphaeae SA-01]|uniref:Uncharacterized protein n=1 Tax=Colletotrichum nymphaeae SA-01 TaxID=1460502 RepID=A0A135TQA4_9PEZI|nr:hypothetical protein CNYM01_08913 [Colletotrichum nymphaeae SA-01]